MIKIFVNEGNPLTIALNFMYDTKLNNILFTKSSRSEYKVKGNYLNNKLEQINLKWINLPGKSNFDLINKLNRHRVLAKAKGFTLKMERTGKIIIFTDVPLDYHNVIVATACLMFKIEQDANMA